MRAPDVVVVGSATRDLSEDDPRGWMLGGGVTFGALALASLASLASTGVACLHARNTQPDIFEGQAILKGG